MKHRATIHGIRSQGYQHESTLGGAWETTRSIWRIGARGGALLSVLCVIATLLIVAVGG